MTYHDNKKIDKNIKQLFKIILLFYLLSLIKFLCNLSRCQTFRFYQILHIDQEEDKKYSTKEEEYGVW